MSIDATKWAWQQKCKPMEKLILVLLADHLNGETARLNPGMTRLAERSGMTKRAVITQLSSLENGGLLLVERKAGMVNNYRMPVNDVHRCSAFTGEAASPPPVNDVHHHPCIPFTGPVNDVHPNRNEPEEEPEIKPEAKKPKSAKAKKPKIVPQISERGFAFAEWFKTLLPETINLAPTWRNEWGKCYDQMIALENRTPEDIARVCRWARADSFWQTNFMSASKLRGRDKNGVKYFDVFLAKCSPCTPRHVTIEARPDPEGWREYLDSVNMPYAPYANGRGWAKEEFRAQKSA